MNVPNALTLSRFILTIIAVVFYCVFGLEVWNMFAIFGIFVLGSVTDFLDGTIARKHNLVTGFGKLMDPIADKMLVIACIFILVQTSSITLWWVLIIIIAREFLVSGIRLAALEGGGEVIAAHLLGKAKTMTQMVSVSILLFTTALSLVVENSFIIVLEVIGLVLFYISTILCVVSGVQYLIQNKKYFKMK